MAMRFEDILSAVCSQVYLQHADHIQIMYLVGNRSEAELALDALITNGFEARLYYASSPDALSKLYIKQPFLDSQITEQKMENALVYIESLKQIKVALDSLCNSDTSPFSHHNYGIVFANTDNGGKQILVQIAPPPESAQGFTADSISPSRRTYRKRAAQSKQPAQTAYFKPAISRDISSDNIVKKMTLPIVGNLNVFWITVISTIIVIIGVANVTYLLSMAILCPDVATSKKSVPAYCMEFTREDEKHKTAQDRVVDELYKKDPQK